jgi:hypothetical protein
VDVFIFRQKEQKKHIFQILLFSKFHHKLQLIFAGKEIPTLPQRITSKGTKKRTKLRSDFAPKEAPKQKTDQRIKKQKLPTAISPKAKSDSPPKNPVLSFGPKSGEAEHGEKKRRLFERSKFLRFRRAKLRSRFETADGGFSFCYLFLFAAKKKK